MAEGAKKELDPAEENEDMAHEHHRAHHEHAPRHGQRAMRGADHAAYIGAGTDVAIESADIVLVRSDPRDVTAIVDLARATYRKMIQNLWWATGYNAFAIPLAAGVAAPVGIVLSPAVGAVLMSVSTVIVAVNARLLHVRGAAAA